MGPLRQQPPRLVVRGRVHLGLWDHLPIVTSGCFKVTKEKEQHLFPKLVLLRLKSFHLF